MDGKVLLQREVREDGDGIRTEDASMSKARYAIVYTVDGKKHTIRVADERQGHAFIQMMKQSDPKIDPILVEE